jgi:RNA polymerase sigma-70 factor, ECF subfamily
MLRAPSGDNGDPALRDLMRRYQAGELPAFEELYRQTLSMMRGYLATVVRDRTHVLDLVQEAYLQLHRSRHTYNGALPVRPWMIGIARHVWLMHRRTRARRLSREVVGLDDVKEPPIPPEIERLGDRDALLKALSRVPDDQRESLVLHHVYGLSFAEIARIAGISAGAARTRASRGMSGMRTALTDVQERRPH